MERFITMLNCEPDMLMSTKNYTFLIRDAKVTSPSFIQEKIPFQIPTNGLHLPPFSGEF
jgi:hypothetical protein